MAVPWCSAAGAGAAQGEAQLPGVHGAAGEAGEDKPPAPALGNGTPAPLSRAGSGGPRGNRTPALGSRTPAAFSRAGSGGTRGNRTPATARRGGGAAAAGDAAAARGSAAEGENGAQGEEQLQQELALARAEIARLRAVPRPALSVPARPLAAAPRCDLRRAREVSQAAAPSSAGADDAPAPQGMEAVGAGVGWADNGGAAAVVAGAADGARGEAAERSEAEGAAAPGARPKTAAASEPAGPPGPPQDFPKLRPKQLAAFNAWARTGWKMPDRANEDALHRDIRLALMRAGRELEYLRAQLAEQRAAAARHQVLLCRPAS